MDTFIAKENKLFLSKNQDPQGVKLEIVCNNSWTTNSLLCHISKLQKTNLCINVSQKIDFNTLTSNLKTEHDKITFVLAKDLNEGVKYAKASLLINDNIEISALTDSLNIIEQDESQDKFLEYFSSTPGNHLNILYTQRQHNTLEKDHAAINIHSYGSLITNIYKTECIIRKSNTILIDLKVLTKSIYNHPENSTAGISIVDLFLLCKMIGSNPNVKSICFYNYDLSYDRDEIISQAIAESVWYFSEGFKHRRTSIEFESTFEISNDNMNLTFYKEQIQNRWWAKLDQSEKFPITKEDYLLAQKDIISDLLLQQIEKYC